MESLGVGGRGDWRCLRTGSLRTGPFARHSGGEGGLEKEGRMGLAAKPPESLRCSLTGRGQMRPLLLPTHSLHRCPEPLLPPGLAALHSARVALASTFHWRLAFRNTAFVVFLTRLPFRSPGLLIASQCSLSLWLLRLKESQRKNPSSLPLSTRAQYLPFFLPCFYVNH